MVHLISIVIWLMVWLNRTNSRCKENYDKLSLMKEDKYIDNYMDNKMDYQNKWVVWRKLAYVGILIGSFSVFWFIFALRYDECSSFLNKSKVEL